jgi:hypothetical protein
MLVAKWVHGAVFMPYRGEKLEDSRWRTPAGAVGRFRSKNYDGSLTLAFPSGTVADYRRERLVRET